MEDVKFWNLPFREDLFSLSEALQYGFSDYATSDAGKSDYANTRISSWQNKVINGTNGFTAGEIKKFKAEHESELAQNPLLAGLLETYLLVHEADSLESLKQIYESYQQLQRDYKFEDHKKEYMDAGCTLCTGYLEKTDDVKLAYPLFLYSAYTQHSGRDDDHRGGFLFPVHNLKAEELKELHDINPEYFASKDVKKNYKKVIKHQEKSDGQMGE